MSQSTFDEPEVVTTTSSAIADSLRRGLEEALAYAESSRYASPSMNILALNENFSIPGVLLFEQHGELTRAVIATPAASAAAL